MSTRWTVRRAVAADATRLAAICLDGWRTAYRGILPDDYLDSLSRPAWDEMFSARVAASTERNTMLVAVNAEGEIGAYAGVLGESEPGMLGALYAAAEWRGTGAGHAAHEAAVAHLAASGFGHAVLWVFERNVPARRFYEAHGWLCDEVTQSTKFADGSAVEIRYSRLLP